MVGWGWGRGGYTVQCMYIVINFSLQLPGLQLGHNLVYHTHTHGDGGNWQEGFFNNSYIFLHKYTHAVSRVSDNLVSQNI